MKRKHIVVLLISILIIAALGVGAYLIASNDQNQTAAGLYSENGDYFYYDEDGNYVTGWQTIDGHRYYFDPDTGMAVQGWFTDEDGAIYYFGPEGYALTGEQVIGGKTYTFDEDGRLLTDAEQSDYVWQTKDGKTYCVDADGNYVTGLAEINGALYYFDEDGVRQSGWHTIDGKKYYFSDLDGRAPKGWYTIEGKTYYFSDEGYALTGEQTIGGQKYTFDENGQLIDKQASSSSTSRSSRPASSSTTQTAGGGGGEPPAAQSTEQVSQYTWKQVDGKYYYQNEAGDRKKGLQQIEGNLYYLDPASGARQYGWQKINGELYYFDTKTGAGAKGWFTTKNPHAAQNAPAARVMAAAGEYTYYFGSNGAAVKGVVTLDGRIYYFNDDFIQKAGWQTVNGKLYYFGDADGGAVTGWADLPGGGRCYLSPEAGNAVTGIAVIGGETYYFISSGAMQTGWFTLNGKVYCFDAEGRAMKNTFADWEGDVYYLGQDGAALTGSQKIDDGQYYFGESGVRQVGWQVVGGKNYYFDPANGQALKSTWMQNGTARLYLGGDGAAVTGVHLIGTSRYYFDSNGVMQTGWQTANNRRYYFASDGVAVSGWQPLGGDKYYFGSEGYALTDIQKVGEHYYFFAANGAMQTGWQTAASGKLYYLQADKEGQALTGWRTEGNDRYYLHATEAYALVNQQFKIGDVTYTFNANGQVVDETRENYTWFTDEEGNKYYTDGNGKFVKGIITITGKVYYFADTGVMQTGRHTVDGNFYIFGTDGAACVGWYTAPAKNGANAAASQVFYFDLLRGYAHTGLTLIDGEHYYFSTAPETLGVMVSGWVELEGQDYFFQQNGKAPKGFFTTEDKTYLFGDEGYILRGLQQYNKAYYYLDENGVRLGGWQQIGEDRYCFDGTDNAAIVGWHVGNDATYYFAFHGAAVNGLQTIEGYKYYFEELKLQTGWKTLSGNRYYFDPDNGGMAKGGWFTDSDGKTYYFGADFTAVTGVCMIDNVEYQFDADGVLLNSEAPTANIWVEEDGKVYYLDENGGRTVGFATIDGSRYYFDAEGVRQSGWIVEDGKKYYFSPADGRGVTGWQSIEGKTYYFGPEGYAFAGTTEEIDGQQYTFDEEGVVTSGDPPAQINAWVNQDGKRYYRDSSGNYATGLVTIDGQIYYFAQDGAMQTGPQTVDGAHYCFHSPDGYALKGWQQIEGRWYRYDQTTAKQLLGWQYRPLEGGGTATHFFHEDGTSPLGWVELNQIERYFFEDGHMALGWEEIDGNTYYFLTNGMKATGSVKIDGVIHFFDEEGHLVSGWQTDGDGNRYYYGEDGVYKGWQQVDGRWYLFDADTGIQQTGWRYRTLDEGGTHTYYYDSETGKLPDEGFGTVNGAYRYFYADGHMAVGWQTIGESKYYFADNGAMATGTQTIGGQTYIFGEDGRLLRGWQTDANGKRYYVTENGLLTGWQKLPDGRWYCFDKDGVQQLGWQNRNDGSAVKMYYYFDDGSLPAEGWTSAIESTRRYVMADGQMAQGWITLTDGRYYFNNNGTCLTGWQLIENRRYVFSDQGVQQTGWQSRTATLGEVKYYYYANGTLPATGWNTIEGKTRYVISDGQMAQGWWPVNGYSYHFNADGTYKTGSHVINGVTCIFTSNGYYIAPPSITKVSIDAGSGNNKKVTVTASCSALLSSSTMTYSFNGGAQWQSGNSKEFGPGVVLPSGTILVKDSVGNIVSYNASITIPAFSGRSFGIDVSAWQGVINWKAAADAGVEFAIIRSLHWSSSKNYYSIDPYFEYNVRNAKANGIKVGTYLYSYAFSYAEMAEEIKFFMNSTEVQRLLGENILFDLPVFIDYEDPLITTNTKNMTISQRTDIVRQGMVMIEQMSKYRYKPGFYTYYNFAKTAINGAELQRDGYDFWLARFDTAAHGWSSTPAIWQYSSKGTVAGVSGNVDVNYCYKDFSYINGGKVPDPVSSYNITVTNQYGQVVTAPAASILAQIVQNEVGGFSSAEVYKAQAVAAHSWIRYQQSKGYTAPQVALKSPTSAVQTAVNQVVNQTLTYGGAPALTSYYAYSNGTTNNSQYWGNNLPYLTSVNSSWDKDKGSYTGRISRGDLKARIEAIYGAGATNGYAEADWIKINSRNAAGYVTSVTVCGRNPSVDYFYQTLIRYGDGYGNTVYPIGSPSFTLSYSSNMWTFTTSGYGHGIGMSQYGASRMAASGSTYKQILAYYYPGTTLTTV